MRLFKNSGSFEKATLDVHAVFLLFFIKEIFIFKLQKYCKSLFQK